MLIAKNVKNGITGIMSERKRGNKHVRTIKRTIRNATCIG